LIDEYSIVVNPIALGKGRTMFEGVKAPVNLKRTSTREFKNGNILTVYSA
jgi:dihydrofolate reductase